MTSGRLAGAATTGAKPWRLGYELVPPARSKPIKPKHRCLLLYLA